MDFESASAFVDRFHRHHGPVAGHKFSIGAVLNGEVVGICIVGRPVARGRQDGWTLEVTRLATDGKCYPTGKVNRQGKPTFHNVCSFLYGAAARAAFAQGYRRIGTYILASEPGISVLGAGWRMVGEVKGRSWSCESRPRIDKHPTEDKTLFELVA